MFATMADSHREWHTNSGIPMGTPGCPQDACHLPDEDYMPTHVVHTPHGTLDAFSFAEAKDLAQAAALTTGQACKVTVYVDNVFLSEV